MKNDDKDKLQDLADFLGEKIEQMEKLYGLPSSKKTDGNVIHVDFRGNKE